ncbi:MAG: hypothetical protein CR982_07345 [Candidatus Cloacimonadota bacterium]|nr:MAG: hypothetical protein CR982_07345 [Candidatus Cloacimonadota bacterium]PIE79448.1 MAG: hypothetical protein CSA15_03080 [Candidatus Delongbacteria bacterium]
MKVVPNNHVFISRLDIVKDVKEVLESIKEKNLTSVARENERKAIRQHIEFIERGSSFFMDYISARLDSSISQLDSDIGTLLN